MDYLTQIVVCLNDLTEQSLKEEKIKHELKTNCRIRLLITNIMPTSDETTEDETYTIHISLNELIAVVFALHYFYVFVTFMRYNFKDKIENI